MLRVCYAHCMVNVSGIACVSFVDSVQQKAALQSKL